MSDMIFRGLQAEPGVQIKRLSDDSIGMKSKSLLTLRLASIMDRVVDIDRWLDDVNARFSLVDGRVEPKPYEIVPPEEALCISDRVDWISTNLSNVMAGMQNFRKRMEEQI